MVINMAEMKYTKIPYVNRPVSRILYGTATDTMIAGKDCKELLDDIFALGVNAFDCAREYKLAEKSLGDWLEARGNRDQVTILSKGGHPGPQWEKRINETEIRKDFACSSGYLKTDYIDIYLLHRDDPMVGVGEIVELLNAMHSEGKIGAFGGSNWTHERIAEANEYAYKHDMLPFTVSSPNFGLANQIQDPFEGGCVTISGPSQETARKWYLDNQMPVIAYSSLGRGLFSGRVKSDDPGTIEKNMDEYARRGYAYEENLERLRRCEELAATKGCTVPQIAMAWIFEQEVNTFAVVSTSKASRMQENIDALHIKLSEQEKRYLDLR